MTKIEEEGLKETILKFVNAINRHDADSLSGLMSADHTFIDCAGERTQGRERMLEGEEGGWKEYFRLYPDYKIHVLNVLVSGSDAAAVIGTVTGSHLGSEKESRTTLIWTARIAGGLVAEWRIYIDK